MKTEAEEATVYTGGKKPSNTNPLFAFVVCLHIFGVQLQAVKI